MGSYNVSCSFSRISIKSGDPVVYIPLEKYRYSEGFDGSSNNLYYPWDFYSPVTLPIFGKYDDYGAIEDIERSKNVTIIENHFGDIKNIVECDKFPEPIISGMFIHRDIYNLLITCDRDEWNGQDRDIKDFESKYDNFKKQIMDSREKSKIFSKAGEKEWNSYIFVDSWNLFNFDDHRTFQEIYRPYIESELLKKELIDFVHMRMNMYSASLLFFPSVGGPQSGNYYVTRALLEESLKINNREINRITKNKIEDKLSTVKWRIKERIKEFFRKDKK